VVGFEPGQSAPATGHEPGQKSAQDQKARLPHTVCSSAELLSRLVRPDPRLGSFCADSDMRYAYELNSYCGVATRAAARAKRPQPFNIIAGYARPNEAEVHRDLAVCTPCCDELSNGFDQRCTITARRIVRRRRREELPRAGGRRMARRAAVCTCKREGKARLCILDNPIKLQVFRL
jgi:hypothetical protein